jgi:hypothetical protein
MKREQLNFEYSCVPNSFMDVHHLLKPCSKDVGIYLMRSIPGWHMLCKEFTVEEIAEATGLTRPSVVTALEELIDFKLIIAFRKSETKWEGDLWLAIPTDEILGIAQALIDEKIKFKNFKSYAMNASLTDLYNSLYKEVEEPVSNLSSFLIYVKNKVTCVKTKLGSLISKSDFFILKLNFLISGLNFLISGLNYLIINKPKSIDTTEETAPLNKQYLKKKYKKETTNKSKPTADASSINLNDQEKEYVDKLINLKLNGHNINFNKRTAIETITEMPFINGASIFEVIDRQIGFLQFQKGVNKDSAAGILLNCIREDRPEPDSCKKAVYQEKVEEDSERYLPILKIWDSNVYRTITEVMARKIITVELTRLMRKASEMPTDLDRTNFELDIVEKLHKTFRLAKLDEILSKDISPEKLEAIKKLYQAKKHLF